MKTLKRVLVLLSVFLFPFFISNCEKDSVSPKVDADALKLAEFSEIVDIDDAIIVLGPELYVRGKGEPQVVSKEINIENYQHFEETFKIVIENGDENGNHRVSSAEVKIDDEVIFTPSEFNAKQELLLTNLKLPNKFKLDVELRGAPGSQFELKIVAMVNENAVTEEVYMKLLESGIISFENVEQFKEEINNARDKVEIQKSSKFDLISNKTEVTLTISSKGKLITDLSLVIYIPKQIANSVEEIEFAVPPNMIIDDDPVVWYQSETLEGTLIVRYTLVGDDPYHISWIFLGNDYELVEIGNQTWMAENLKSLPEFSPPSLGSVEDPHYYVYGYEGEDFWDAMRTENYNEYGVLYNWPAAMEVCPIGWHLPSDTEWKEMEVHLGMSLAELDNQGMRGTTEGGKLKEVGFSHWLYPNFGAINESGFSAIPGGFRSNGGNFLGLGYNLHFWSSSINSSSTAWYRYLDNNHAQIFRSSHFHDYGLSVRCVKN